MFLCQMESALKEVESSLQKVYATLHKNSEEDAVLGANVTDLGNKLEELSTVLLSDAPPPPPPPEGVQAMYSAAFLLQYRLAPEY